ncbi:hypothetical protein BDP27DRAFT_108058 [Rhodocollybia butyracea]|uniref:Uncharacterized protein n=1 Tax=Rhodocollybia butyracea TaxID=206335 RepID=A0A9P5U4P4_9AGAR|nr:hypothetical protein BDP27DRAFT_108058 [Rhodocollybia butyracea]
MAKQGLGARARTLTQAGAGIKEKSRNPENKGSNKGPKNKGTKRKTTRILTRSCSSTKDATRAEKEGPMSIMSHQFFHLKTEENGSKKSVTDDVVQDQNMIKSFSRSRLRIFFGPEADRASVLYTDEEQTAVRNVKCVAFLTPLPHASAPLPVHYQLEIDVATT